MAVVITAIHYLRRKLVGTGFVIEAKTGAGAGYRLVPASAGMGGERA